MYLHDDMRGGPNLAKRIQSATSHKNFLFGDFPQSMFLNLATQEEIGRYCMYVSSGKIGRV